MGLTRLTRECACEGRESVVWRRDPDSRRHQKGQSFCVLCVCEGVDTLNKGQAKGKVVMATGSEERKALCQLRE